MEAACRIVAVSVGSREMLAGLAGLDTPHEFVVFVDRPSLDGVHVPDRFETVAVDVTEAPSRAASASGRRRVRDMLSMGRAVALECVDLIYFPASYSFFPVWNVGRVVVTMHDTLALAHPELVFPSWQGRVAWTVKEHAAARWADCIITVSEAARRDLCSWFHRPEDEVRVVGEDPDAVFRPLPRGPESDAALARHGVEPGSRYVLYVGGLSPHKNLPRLIEAFAQADAGDCRLVLVGDMGDVFHTHVPELRAAVARCGLDDRVHFTGYVPDEDLAFLYNRAYALAQPSLMEGFGLPAVEAMACGVPVVCSHAGSLPEVVGPAGLYFDPTSVSEMAETLRGLLANPARRDALAERALIRASRFTWDAAARTLIDAFEDLGPARLIRRSA